MRRGIRTKKRLEINRHACLQFELWFAVLLPQNYFWGSARWMKIGQHSIEMKRSTILFFSSYVWQRDHRKERKNGACATINYSNQVNNVLIYESDLRSPYAPFHHQFCYWLTVASNPLEFFCHPIVFIELLYIDGWRKFIFLFFFSYICAETFWRSCWSTRIDLYIS